MKRYMIPLRAILVVIVVTGFGSAAAQVSFKTSQLTMVLDAKAHITGLKDKAGKEYLAPGQPAPLLSVFTGGKLLHPEKMRWQNASKIIVLNYPGWKGEVNIKVVEKPDYVTLELVNIRNNEEVEYIVWGPYPTIITKQIGETVGTVWDEAFGIGLQALNIKTLGGYPSEDNDIEPSFDIFSESSGLKDISPEHKVLYRGQTAKLTGFGSIIQAYSRNRYKQRVVENWGHDKYVVPAYPQDGGVIGSKIALWGAPQEQLLSVIEKIELQENLPHPTINGVWAKRSPLATSSYLIMGFGEQTIEEALELTQKAGLKYLYHPGPFETWGHFGLNKKQFPDERKSMKRCVDIAAKKGIGLGVHTLSSFITTNDPFVTPVPDKRLAKVGSGIITSPVDEKATVISIASPDFFNQMKNNNLKTVMLGSELIRYRDVSQTVPWQLLDCVRGAFGTKAQSHQQGDTIAKLMDHGYKVFLPDMELQDEITANIARLFNETDLQQISFDGLEGSWSTGMGQYATQLFVKKWYDLLKPALKGKVINDASGPGHFFWHIFTRMNWGEPWYAGFRESQTQYRLKNQDYYYRNLMPRMLGWFQLGSTTTLEDIEWLLARAAGFDAGFALSTSLAELKKHGRMDLLLQTVAEWEKARLSGAFQSTQKDALRDINKEFHLSKVDDRNWDLFPVNNVVIQHQQKIRQPGEPVYSDYSFNNPFDEQPLQFVAHITGGPSSASWEQPSVEINNYAKLEIPFTVAKGQWLVCNGKQVILYDHEWHTIKEIAVQQLPVVATGANKILIEGIISGEQSPAVKIEFKTVGKAERISAAR
ncbi:MAG: hypothetical protein KF746_18660 [Chitinophagaceae bacterium]|nr:hypothetical protein [Chitinophagaceae bacterium]